MRVPTHGSVPVERETRTIIDIAKDVGEKGLEYEIDAT
jgi:hypothetical protein